MEEEKKHIDELIATYLTEGLDKNALAELKAWIAASPENEDYFIRQREVWFSAVSREAASKYNKDKAFDTFKKRIGNRKEIEKTSHHGFRLSMLWRYAAIIAVILAVGCFSYWQGGVNVKDTFADISVEAPLGSRTKLYLPDGTLVWLNAGSRMTYSQGFGVDNRMIELEGEGYFEVQRNEKLPFFVKTKDLQLQVLGTKFNVEGYSDKDDFEVTLMEGSVRVASRIGLGDTLMLKPDSKACLQKDGRLKVIPVDDYNPYRWKEGLICFRNESFLSIMNDLEKYFGVSIVVENKNVLKYYFTGKFRQADGIDYALRVLQRDIRFKYERDDENQIIYIR